MVKFVCGKQGPEGGKEPVQPGQYSTAINIHNYTSHWIRIYKRPALHYAEYENVLPPTFPNRRKYIAARRVLEIDCVDLWRLTKTSPPEFIKGMVDIASWEPLPIAAVYTTGGTDASGVTTCPTIDVEYIQPFRHPVGAP